MDTDNNVVKASGHCGGWVEEGTGLGGRGTSVIVSAIKNRLFPFNLYNIVNCLILYFEKKVVLSPFCLFCYPIQSFAYFCLFVSGTIAPFKIT